MYWLWSLRCNCRPCSCCKLEKSRHKKTESGLDWKNSKYLRVCYFPNFKSATHFYDLSAVSINDQAISLLSWWSCWAFLLNHSAQTTLQVYHTSIVKSLWKPRWSQNVFWLLHPCVQQMYLYTSMRWFFKYYNFQEQTIHRCQLGKRLSTIAWSCLEASYTGPASKKLETHHFQIRIVLLNVFRY